MQADLYNLWNRVKSGVSEIVKSRTFIAIIVFCVLSAVLLQRVFYLQIVKGQNYTDKYELQIQKTKEVEGTRGNIYDRNGVLLAYNELAYSVTIQDNGDYDKKSEKNKALNQIVTKVINIVEQKCNEIITTNDNVDINDEFIVEKENGKIITLGNELKLLESILEMGEKDIVFTEEENVLKPSVNYFFNVATNINDSEVIRDFNRMVFGHMCQRY